MEFKTHLLLLTPSFSFDYVSSTCEFLTMETCTGCTSSPIGEFFLNSLESYGIEIGFKEELLTFHCNHLLLHINSL